MQLPVAIKCPVRDTIREWLEMDSRGCTSLVGQILSILNIGGACEMSFYTQCAKVRCMQHNEHSTHDKVMMELTCSRGQLPKAGLI